MKENTLCFREIKAASKLLCCGWVGLGGRPGPPHGAVIVEVRPWFLPAVLNDVSVALFPGFSALTKSCKAGKQ